MRRGEQSVGCGPGVVREKKVIILSGLPKIPEVIMGRARALCGERELTASERAGSPAVFTSQCVLHVSYM